MGGRRGRKYWRRRRKRSRWREIIKRSVERGRKHRGGAEMSRKWDCGERKGGMANKGDNGGDGDKVGKCAGWDDEEEVGKKRRRWW